MPDLPRYYQPDAGVARRKGENPQPVLNVDKPVAMKFRMAMRPNTPTKHYKRKRSMATQPDDRKRTFY